MKTSSHTSRSRFLSASALLMLGVLALGVCSQSAFAQQPAKEPAKEPAKQQAPKPTSSEKSPNYYYPTVELWYADGDNIYNANAGNVGVGTSTPETILHVATESTDAPRGLMIQQSNEGNNSAFLVLRKSRGSIYSPGSIVNGDSLGAIYAEAHTGAAYLRTGANIRFISNGTVTESSVPTDITFSAGSSGTGTEFMRITSVGNVGIGTSAPATSLHVATESSVSPRGITNSQHSADANGGVFGLRKSRGTIASPAAAVNGDSIGNLYSEGYDGTSYVSGGRVRFVIDGPVSTGVVPTAVQFFSGTGNFGGVERMRINSAGNVGIGTSAPGYLLDVQGNAQWLARFKKTDATNGGIIIDSSTGYNPNLAMAVNGAVKWYINSNSANGDTLQFWESTGNFARFTVAQNGNVGIGNTSPNFRLDVGGQLNVSAGLCIATDCKSSWSEVGGSQWSNGTGSIHYNSGNVGIGTGSPVAGLDVQVPLTAVTAHGVRFQQSLTAGNNNAELNGLFINPNFIDGMAVGVRHNALVTGAGNVGIGTSATSAGLDVQNIGIAASGTTYGTRFQQVIPSAGNNATSTAVYINPTFSDGQAIGVRHNGLVVTSGDVGIGTASPAVKLDVSGQVHVAGVCGASVPNSQGGYVSWNQRSCGGGEMDFINHQGGGTGGFWFANSANGSTLSSLMSIKGDGKVGIGTDSPNERLEIAGNLKLTGSGNITASGEISGGTIVAKYQDVAEWVESSQALPAGTVVVLDHTRSNQVVASSQSYDTRVAGVISAQPGITLGEKGENKVLVATTGRVKVRVDATAGPIQVGDLLVTSDVQGFAKKSAPLNLGGVQIHRPGTLIGKALEPLAGGTGEILVLLSLQ